MNIFVLDEDPVEAARMHCDRHVVKMVTEQAQLLCFAHHVANDDKRWVERNIAFAINKGHLKHPCTIWTVDDPRHYAWGYDLLVALLDEYDHRYDGLRRGNYARILQMLPALKRIPGTNQTVDDVRYCPDEFVLAMGRAPECIGPNAVEAYRRFYIVNKQDFATWKNREVPEWYARGVKQFKRHGNIQRVTVQ